MDIALQMLGNGGDISIKNADIEMTVSFFNMPLLALFGGNVEASTTNEEEQPEQRFDFWGNSYLEEEAQMNSLTERALNQNALDSKGRSVIENDIKDDISFMSKYGDVSANASIEEIDKLNISISINQKNNRNTDIYDYIWDANSKELLTEKTI